MPKPNRQATGSSQLALIVAGLALWLPQAAYPWTHNGHRVVGEIADRHLTPEVRARIASLLDGRSLAQISTWPDDVRPFPEWHCANPFHFVTVEPGTDYPGQGVPEGDAIMAIVYYVDVLRDDAAELESRRVALKFLVHLVGDLHQPLHVGRGCDRGGGLIEVDWFGDSVNFHNLWDEQLIESENLSYTELADFVDHASAEEIAAYQDSTPIDWTREAQPLLDAAYLCDVEGDRCPCFCGDCADGLSPFGGCVERRCTLTAAGPVRLAYAYKARVMPMVLTQLMKAGARLAGMLSWIFDDRAQPPPAYRQMRAAMRELPTWSAAEATMKRCGGSP